MRINLTHNKYREWPQYHRSYSEYWERAVAQLVEDGKSRVRFLMISFEFLIYIIFLVDPASNRNEYQECLGSKSGRCVGPTTLPPSCADCLEIWEPQPSRTLRGCPGLYSHCYTFYIQSVFVILRGVAHNSFTSYRIGPRYGASSEIEVFHCLILTSFPMIVYCIELTCLLL